MKYYMIFPIVSVMALSNDWSSSMGSVMTRKSMSKQVRVAPDASLSKRLVQARILLLETPLIDGYGVSSWEEGDFVSSTENGSFKTEIQRKAKSQLDKNGYQNAVQFWTANVPCHSQYLNPVQLLMEHLDMLKRIISTKKSQILLSKSAKDIVDAFNQNKMAGMLSVNGGHSVASSMGVIRSLYDLGVRHISLTHKCHTPWAESTEKNPLGANSPGLTPFGKAILLELNRLGFLIDLSESSFTTARQVLNASKSPVLFAHSAARKLCSHRRNLPDDIIHSVAKNGGIIMVSFVPQRVSCGTSATVKDIIAHINHVRSMAGVDHVGLGAGWKEKEKEKGGHGNGEKDSKSIGYLNLFAELLKDSSWSIQDLKKLAGLNFLRVFGRVEEIRAQLVNLEPSETLIPIHDIESRWNCRFRFANAEVRGR